MQSWRANGNPGNGTMPYGYAQSTGAFCQEHGVGQAIGNFVRLYFAVAKQDAVGRDVVGCSCSRDAHVLAAGKFCY